MGIKFISSWSNFEKNTWSGTPFGIYRALCKKTDVQFFDASMKRKGGFISAIKNKIESFGANIKSLHYGIQRIDEMDLIEKNIPALVFSEYNSKNARNLYCYQDLSIDFVIRSKRNGSGNIFSYILQKNYEKKNKIAVEFYKNCGGVFTMSEWLKRDMVENTGIPADKVYAVGGGINVDADRIDYSKKQGNKFIFVGKKWDLKNGDLVVRAFEKLREKHPEVSLYIAGPAKMPKILKGKENIHFLGRVPVDKLYEYYNLCDYFVMPSEYDAYGLVFIEALCFGLPAIGKNHYAMPEFIQEGENGYLINKSSEDELCEKMELLLKNSGEIVKNVRARKEYYIKKYSWDSVADRIIEVMKKDGFVL